MQHDASKDLYTVPMDKKDQSTPTETFTIELNPTSGGGILVLLWGNTSLSADFTFAQ
jgi:hypothetical protein